jgi:hypothetical protein
VADPIILDCLTLFGPVPPLGAAETGTSGLTELMSRHGIAGAIALSTRGLYHSAPAGNRETIALCQAAGPALQPAALLDPRLPLSSQSVTGARLLCLAPSVQGWPIPFEPLTELLRSLVTANSTVPLYCDISRSGDGTKLAEILDDIDFSSPVLLGALSGDSLIEAVAIARVNKQISLVTNGL